ncbi:hypothetical protein ACSMX9_03265 [Streptomyces sp. LE64]|uniref:hypothetical protein n=1 Tax=Streptomyces sp. LE64 TaxID=3448653 RepID=UPI0040425D5C
MSQTDDFLRKDNPFPSSPVVQLGSFADAVRMGTRRPKRYPTIVTAELARLRRQVAEYLERPGPGGDLGRAVALVGDFGVGKTHMAREVTAAIRADASIPLWVINQPALDLVVVYRNRMVSLRHETEARIAFERVVSAYYANVVVELLTGPDAADLHIGPQHKAVIAGLSDGTFDPRKVIQAFGIDKELMHRHLREHLRVAVDHRRFAVALALLLEGDFKREVWDWLTAAEPSQALRERGIDGPIDSTEAVFDALCVFSFLQGRVGQRYVLVIDALETVLSWPQRERSEFMNGFEKLVNTYVNQDGLLVMCIQPEPWSRMPQGLHERVLQLWPTGLDGPETARLVSGYLRVGGFRPGTGAADPGHEDHTDPSDFDTTEAPTRDDTEEVLVTPFTPEAVAAVAELSNGVPREVLKVCRQAWQLTRDALAVQAAAAVTPADGATGPPPEAAPVVDVAQVHAAVRQMYEQRADADVLRTVERALAQGQWRRESRPPELGDPAPPGTREVAYWVRVGAGAVLGVLPAASVLEPYDVERIGRVTRAAHRAFPRGECEILVVANGYVSRAMRDRIAETTRTSPVVVTDTGFAERLDHAVDVLARRLEAAQRESTLDQVRARLGRVTEQQSGTLERIEHLDARLERLALAPVRTDGGPGSAGDGGGAALPQTVRRLFTEAVDALDRLMGEPVDLRRSLGVDATGMAPPDGRPQRVTFTAPQFQAIGVTTLVRMLIRTFRDSVGDWLATVADGGADPTEEERNSLFVLCRSFEITVEVLPEIRPDTLPPGPDALDRGTREVRSTQVAEMLSTLAERVQAAVLASVTNGRNGGGEPSAAVR